MINECISYYDEFINFLRDENIDTITHVIFHRVNELGQHYESISKLNVYVMFFRKLSKSKISHRNLAKAGEWVTAQFMGYDDRKSGDNIKIDQEVKSIIDDYLRGFENV